MKILQKKTSLSPSHCFFAFYIASFLHLYDRLISYNYKDFSGMTLSDSYLFSWIPDGFPLNEVMTFLNPLLIGFLVLLLPFIRLQSARVIWFVITFLVEGFRFYYSQGHDAHLYVWLTLILALHPGDLYPDETSPQPGPLFLLACQLQILLVYSLSGIWKIFGYLNSHWNNNIAAGIDYLPYAIATEYLNSGTANASSLWLIENPSVSLSLTFLMFLAQAGSLFVPLFPQVFFIWGILLALFHVGAMVSVGVVFTWSVFPIVIFLCLANQNQDAGFLVKLADRFRHIRNIAGI